MKYISMFSGIEAASAAWGPLGWEPLAFAEIEKFPSAILAHHYPRVPSVGDILEHDWAQYRGRCDMVVGGPPCQAFSVAGLRKSLSDARGNLSLQYMRAIHEIDPEWCITENVPGWLSTRDNAFGCFLAGLVGADEPIVPEGKWPRSGVVAGPSRTAAWRVLDAQYFGLAQRRKRVFVLSTRGSGDWRCAAALFPVGESVQGHPAPRRETGQGVAAPTSSGAGTCSGDDKGGRRIAFGGGNTAGPIDAATSCNAHGVRLDFDSETLIIHSLRGEGFDASEDGTGRGTPIVAFSCKDHGADAGDVSPPLRAMNHNASHANAGGQVAVAFQSKASSTNSMNPNEVAPSLDVAKAGGMAVAFTQNQAGDVLTGGVCHSLGTNQNATGRNAANVQIATDVRRLTPRECERLQGFPDDYTRIPWRGKPTEDCPDGPRYKALGNSMAVPVMRWLGERIVRVRRLRPPPQEN